MHSCDLPTLKTKFSLSCLESALLPRSCCRAPCIIQEALVSPGCTRAASKVHRTTPVGRCQVPVASQLLCLLQDLMQDTYSGVPVQFACAEYEAVARLLHIKSLHIPDNTTPCLWLRGLPSLAAAVMVSTSTGLPARLMARQDRSTANPMLGSCTMGVVTTEPQVADCCTVMSATSHTTLARKADALKQPLLSHQWRKGCCKRLSNMLPTLQMTYSWCCKSV